MTTHRDHLEVRPVDAKSLRPLFARPHYVRRVAANGNVLWHTEGYSNGHEGFGRTYHE